MPTSAAERPSLHLSVLAVVLGLAAASGACGARSELLSSGAPGSTDAGGAGAGGVGGGGDAGGSGGAGGGACGALGASCAADTDCCEGTCIQGTCAAPPPPCAEDEGNVILMSGLTDPYSMDGDPTSLFVGQLEAGKDLLRVPKAGGPSEVLVASVDHADFIVVQQKTVFFASEDAVRSVPAAGGSSSLLAGAFGPAGFAVTNEDIFLAEYLAQDLVRIDRESLATEVLASGLSGIYRVAVAQGNVFFSSFLPGLHRYGVATGALDVIAPELGSPRAVLAFHDDVYFTVPSSQRIYRLPPGSESPELVADLASLGVFPEALVTDGEHLYTTLVTGKGPGLVVRAPIDGGEPEVVVADAGTSPSALVVDKACVYWTERTSGTVFRARKSPGPP
jgi:hypothetical protein